MPISEAKKRANAKWNKANIKTFSIGLNVEQYERLQKYCESNNIQKSSLIKSRIDDIINPK